MLCFVAIHSYLICLFLLIFIEKYFYLHIGATLSNFFLFTSLRPIKVENWTGSRQKATRPGHWCQVALVQTYGPRVSLVQAEPVRPAGPGCMSVRVRMWPTCRPGTGSNHLSPTSNLAQFPVLPSSWPVRAEPVRAMARFLDP